MWQDDVRPFPLLSGETRLGSCGTYSVDSRAATAQGLQGTCDRCSRQKTCYIYQCAYFRWICLFCPLWGFTRSASAWWRWYVSSALGAYVWATFISRISLSRYLAKKELASMKHFGAIIQNPEKYKSLLNNEIFLVFKEFGRALDDVFPFSAAQTYCM